MRPRYFRITVAEKPKDKIWVRVSKKVSKRAVDRNKLRRQVKEMLRELNIDYSQYVISVFPQALGKSYKALKKDLRKYWK